MAPLPPLKQWLFENHCYIKKGDSRPYTHLLLDGGKLHISPALTQLFYDKYARDLKNKQKLYICETKTEVFKLFCDLDFFEDAPLDLETIKKYTRVIQEAVKCMYSTEDFEQAKLIVCTTESKEVDVNGAMYIKTGVHLLWTGGIQVDKDGALTLRKAMIQLLEKRFGQREVYNPWSDVVDETVFKENGLRMVGSRKMSKCKVCKGKAAAGGTCTNEKCERGKVDEGRVYWPVVVFDSHLQEDPGFLEELNSNMKRLVRETSIVVHPRNLVSDTGSSSEDSDSDATATANKKKAGGAVSGVSVTPFTTFPVWFDNSADQEKKMRREKQKKKRVQPPGTEEREIMSKIHKTRIDPEDQRVAKLNTFCRRVMPGVFSKANIVDLYLCEGDDKTEFYLATLDTNFCMNVGREHNSNRVYYYINTSAVYQKCFCTCDTLEGRKFGEKCMDFRSSGRELSNIIKYLLFPQEKQRARDKTKAVVSTPATPPELHSKHKKVDQSVLDRMKNVLDILYEGIVDKKRIEDTTYNK